MFLSEYNFSLKYDVFNFAAKITSVPCKLVAKYTSRSQFPTMGMFYAVKGGARKFRTAEKFRACSFSM